MTELIVNSGMSLCVAIDPTPIDKKDQSKNTNDSKKSSKSEKKK